MLESLEMLPKALDESYGADVIHLSVYKVYDTVPHQNLLLKLQSYGLLEKYINWIANFLAGMTMRVGVERSFFR
jgi:hypothetical protein